MPHGAFQGGGDEPGGDEPAVQPGGERESGERSGQPGGQADEEGFPADHPPQLAGVAARLQERAAGRDEGGGAQEGDEGAEEPGFAVPEGLEGVTQHHAGNSAAGHGR